MLSLVVLFPSSLVVVVSSNCAYFGARFGSRRSKGIRFHNPAISSSFDDGPRRNGFGSNNNVELRSSRCHKPSAEATMSAQWPGRITSLACSLEQSFHMLNATGQEFAWFVWLKVVSWVPALEASSHSLFRRIRKLLLCFKSATVFLADESAFFSLTTNIYWFFPLEHPSWLWWNLNTCSTYAVLFRVTGLQSLLLRLLVLLLRQLQRLT